MPTYYDHVKVQICCANMLYSIPLFKHIFCINSFLLLVQFWKRSIFLYNQIFFELQKIIWHLKCKNWCDSSDPRYWTLLGLPFSSQLIILSKYMFTVTLTLTLKLAHRLIIRYVGHKVLPSSLTAGLYSSQIIQESCLKGQCYEIFYPYWNTIPF